MTYYLFALVNILEHVCNHRRSSRTPMDFAADVAFVNSRKRISCLVGWQESREPGCGALFVFWSPLRGAGFACDFNIIEARLMRGATCTIHNINHSGAQLVQRLGREIECAFGAHLVRGRNLAIEC